MLNSLLGNSVFLIDCFSFFRIKRKGEEMITVEEKNFLEAYKKASYHRFYEIERFVNLCKKLNKCPQQADKN